MNVRVFSLIPLMTCLLAPALGQANIIGSDFRNFNPSLSTQDVTTVHTGRTLGRGRLGLGLFIDHAVNTLPYFNDPSSSNRDREKTFNDHITSVETQIVYGILDNWDLALAAPSVVHQSYKEDGQPHGYFSQLGNTELRISTKVGLYAIDHLSLALVATANYNRVKDNPYTGDVKWPSQSLEFVTTLDRGGVEWSVNIGYRWRHDRSDPELKDTLPIDPYVDQLLGSSSLVFDLPQTEFDLVTEIYGTQARNDVSELNARDASILEGQIGFRRPLPYNLQWHGGVGSELQHAVSSADFRVYTGVRWVMDTRSEKDSKKSEPAPEPPVAPASLVLAGPISERRPDRTFEVDEIYFHFDSSEIRDPAGYKVMDSLAQALAAGEIERVLIEGHTCALGSDDYNLDLSERRASAIERWLVVNNRVPPEKLLTVAWGERQLKVKSKQEEVRRMNRRVTFKIFYKHSQPPAASPSSLAH